MINICNIKKIFSPLKNICNIKKVFAQLKKYLFGKKLHFLIKFSWNLIKIQFKLLLFGIAFSNF